MPTIQNRRATAAQWTAVNPVLAAGEIGFELDTNALKVGDGLTAWETLPYLSDESIKTLVESGRLSESTLDATYADRDTVEVGRLSPLALDSSYAAPDGPARIALDLPTSDGNPNVGHPHVLYFPGGWNGWHYWMAMTPYPAEARENPEILVSQNGVDWQVPPGLTNPMAPLSEATANGYTYWADTDLVLLPDNRLACYFKGQTTTGQELVRKVSADGVTWGPVEKLITGGGEGQMTSPALVREDDGAITLWYVDTSKPNAEMWRRRTSPDGVTFSADQAVAAPLPTNGRFWHLNVVKVDGTYHALMNTQDTWRVLYYTSADGITWTAPHLRAAIRKTGTDVDSWGHYRSSLLPRPGGKFDVYATGIRDTGNATAWTSTQWRVFLLRDFNPAPRPTMADEVVWLHAPNMEVGFGSPVRSVVGSTYPVIGLPDGAASAVAGYVGPVPSHWSAFAVDVCAANAGSTGGVARLEGRVYQIEAVTGASALPNQTAATPVNVTVSPNMNAPQTHQLTDGITVLDGAIGRLIRVSLTRVSGHADDTLTQTLNIIGIRLRRTA